MISAFKNIFDSVASYRTEVNNLRDSIEKKKQEREKLLTLPLSRKELGEKLCGLVERQGSAYIGHLERTLECIRNKPFDDFYDSQINIITTYGYASKAGFMPKENIAWFLGDLMKQRIRDAVDKMEWPDEDVGPPLLERKQRIEVLDKEILLLEAKEREIADQVNRAGIRID